MSTRTRFAPSPSGDLHVGNARTALVNYLYARKNSGTLVFRIEDTDSDRSDDASIEAIVESMNWLGLDWDEGPEKGGPHEPYQQSKRFDLYKKYADELLGKGAAYYCFSTPEELEEISKKRQQGGAKEKHPDRDLDLAEAKKRAETESYVIRFAVDALVGDIEFNDAVRGDMSFAYKEIGDFNLLRADGRPMYNFAAVIDDHSMEISHVVRGEDGLSNTPRQIELYKALGWDAPMFAHLPLILGEDGSKLSKRHGDTAVGDFRRKGYLPEALLNYLGLLGIGGYGEGKDFHDLPAMVENFGFDMTVKKASVFDYGKLDYLNAHYIQKLNVEELLECGKQWLADVDETVDLKKAAKAVQGNITTLVELGKAIDHLANGAAETEKSAYVDFVKEFEGAPEVWKALDALIEKEGLPEDPAEIKGLMKTIQKDTGHKGKGLFMPVRFALTGELHGPDLPLVMDAFGAAQCRQRIQRAISRVS